jgi:hypothetical protein
MRTRVSRLVPAAALAAAVSAVVAAAPSAEKRCCFTNTRYTGVCIVEPGEGETCESILSYLNSAGTTGKTYCGSTEIRRGWKQMSCPIE